MGRVLLGRSAVTSSLVTTPNIEITQRGRVFASVSDSMTSWIRNFFTHVLVILLMYQDQGWNVVRSSQTRVTQRDINGKFGIMTGRKDLADINKILFIFVINNFVHSCFKLVSSSPKLYIKKWTQNYLQSKHIRYSVAQNNRKEYLTN